MWSHQLQVDCIYEYASVHPRAETSQGAKVTGVALDSPDHPASPIKLTSGGAAC